MKFFVSLVCVVGCSVGCGAPAAAPGNAETPLQATFEGRPFVPRGIIGKRDGAGIDIFLYDRAAACGTPSESNVAGERYFDIVLKPWPITASSKHIDAHAEGIGLNAIKQDGGTSTSAAIGGYIQIEAASPTGGTLIIHGRGDEASLDGELQFVMCN